MLCVFLSVNISRETESASHLAERQLRFVRRSSTRAVSLSTEQRQHDGLRVTTAFIIQLECLIWRARATQTV
ncbi:unnamed protein product [Oikopleura dioica]|uniref:Uncharacterized protein n=1 Tax=Oikopleura dioica TaxID=34765 RepID=E4WQ67_OIKDI|nr:unnamed protein product [Oikopleura dioica]